MIEISILLMIVGWFSGNLLLFFIGLFIFIVSGD